MWKVMVYNFDIKTEHRTPWFNKSKRFDDEHYMEEADALQLILKLSTEDSPIFFRKLESTNTLEIAIYRNINEN